MNGYEKVKIKIYNCYEYSYKTLESIVNDFCTDKIVIDIKMDECKLMIIYKGE